MGPRNCLGKVLALAQLRAVVAKLLWRFEIEGAEGGAVDWRALKTSVLVEKKEIRVRFLRRGSRSG